MDHIRAFWNKSLLNKAILSLVGLLLISCCVGGVLGQGRGQQTASTGQQVAAGGAAAEATAVPEATQAPEATDEPTATAGPTNTPEPTETPAPTNTPVPTDTPEPTATPVPPVALEGSGQAVTDMIVPPSGVNRVTFTHQGRRNFIVKVYTGAGEDLLVNKVGVYEGSRPLFTDEQVFFEINADGPWSILIEPIAFDESIAGGFTGQGDAVSGVFTPPSSGPVPFDVLHTGDRNFIVYLHCAGGSNLLQNEVGAVGGSFVVRYDNGPCLWEVQADGEWTLTPRQ